DVEAHKEPNTDPRGGGEREDPAACPGREPIRSLEREATRNGTLHHSRDRDRRHHLPVPLAIDETRYDFAVPRAAEIGSGERQSSRGMARRDHLRTLAVEGENVELPHVLADGQDLLDLVLQEQSGLELVPIPDGRGDFPGEGDGAVLQIVLDPSATQVEAQRREAEGRDDHHGDTEENQLLAHAQTHDSPDIPRDTPSRTLERR